MTRSSAAAAGLCLALAACKPSAPAAVAPQAAPNTVGPPGSALAPAAADAGPEVDLDKLDTSDPKQLMLLVDKMGGKLQGKPKTFEVLNALGNLYYENGRYLDAVDTYRQALLLSAPLEEKAGALRKKGVKAAAQVPLECRRAGPAYGLVEIAKQVDKLEPRQPAVALRCANEALGMAVAARARRGNGLYLVGNPDEALAEHRRVLEVEPDYPESLFFVGAILLEKSRLEPALRPQGKKLWERLLVVAPDHPRGQIVRENLPKIDTLFAPPDARRGPVAAGSQLPPDHPPVGGQAPGAAQQGELPPNHPPIGSAAAPGAGGEPTADAVPNDAANPEGGPTAEQVKNVAEAVANTERTPALEQTFDAAITKGEQLLDQGNYVEARSALLLAMPMRPSDPKLAAALGGAMRGLGKTAMAERTLSRALELDPKSARANYELGMLLAARGDKPGALARLQAAQAADASFANKHKLEQEIARLR